MSVKDLRRNVYLRITIPISNINIVFILILFKLIYILYKNNFNKSTCVKLNTFLPQPFLYNLLYVKKIHVSNIFNLYSEM